MPSSGLILYWEIILKQVYYVTGGCGSGKTEEAITYMHDTCLASGKNILLVQPTKALLEETKRRIEGRFPNQEVVIIHGDNKFRDQPVHARITDFMTKPHKGVILGITHSAFFGMTGWRRIGAWELIIDEVPAVDGTFQLNVPRTFSWFISDFETEKGHGNFLRLKPAARRAHFDDVAANKDKDELYAVLKELYAKVNSRSHDVWVARSNWNKLGHASFGSGQNSALICHWTLRPEVFADWDAPTIMGANFTSSMLSLIWENKVEFLPHPTIHTRYEQYPPEISKRLTFHFVSERSNSVKLQNRLGSSFEQIINDAIRELWGNAPYLLVVNNSKKESFEIQDSGQHIPAICHGRNDWNQHTRIAFVAALNDTPPHYKFLHEVVGLLPERVRQAKSQEVIHQAIMRTALRDPTSTLPVEALVVDRETAYHLKDRLFPAARVARSIEIHQGLVERDAKAREQAKTKLAQSQTELNKKSRDAKKRLLEDQRLLKELLSGGHNIMCDGSSPTQVRCYDQELNNKPEIITSGVLASFLGSKMSPDVLPEHFTNWHEVRELMQSAYGHQYKAKDDNLLISGARFNSELSPDTSRGLANIEYVAFMQLDFDGGELGLDELKLIFDDFSWLAYNSFNNDISMGQLRYRVFIPFRHPVTAAYYHALWDKLASRIADNGFSVGKQVKCKRCSGLDKSKRPANSIFYMPCQARTDYRRNSFFDDSFWDEAMIIDPLDTGWVEAMAIAVDEARIPMEFEKSAELKALQDAVLAKRSHADEADWNDLMTDIRTACMTASPGEGNDVLFNQAVRLKRHGVNGTELEQNLKSLTTGMRHPAERRAQVPSILSSLELRAA